MPWAYARASKPSTSKARRDEHRQRRGRDRRSWRLPVAMRQQLAKSRRDAAIARIAANQHGVLSSPQLNACGVDASGIKRRVAAGRLHHVHRGVYAVGHPNLSNEGRWTAAVLAYGDGAVLSHQSAAALWRSGSASRSRPGRSRTFAGSSRRKSSLHPSGRRNTCACRWTIPLLRTTPAASSLEGGAGAVRIPAVQFDDQALPAAERQELRLEGPGSRCPPEAPWLRCSPLHLASGARRSEADRGRHPDAAASLVDLASSSGYPGTARQLRLCWIHAGPAQPD
jgi:Transcriptional regulator, AbiEi antitoxin